MKKYSWIIALLVALTLGFVFASCDNGYGGDGKDPRKVAGQGPGPVGPTGPQVGDVVLELDDLIGDNDVDDVITTLPAPFAKSGSVTLTVTADGVEVSGRTADHNGIDVNLDNALFDFGSYEYSVEFAGYTSPVGGAAVKIGQNANPYTDLFALTTIAADTPVEGGVKDVSPTFNDTTFKVMRIAAANIPYTAGHSENFTVTKFVIKVKAVK